MSNKYAALAGTQVSYDPLRGTSWTLLGGISDVTDLPGGDEEDLDITNVDQRLTLTARTGSTHSGTAVIDAMDTTNLLPNVVVVAAGVPAGTRIVSVDSGVQITVDQVSTATASPTISFIAPDLLEQFAPSWEDPGKLGLTMQFDEDKIATLKTLRRALMSFKIEYSTGAYQTFLGWIKPLKFKGTKKDKVLFDVMIRISGAVTFHKAGT